MNFAIAIKNFYPLVLTLSACTEVMVVSCLCICLLPRWLLHASFAHRNCGIIGFLLTFSTFATCGFSKGRFVQ